MAPNCGVQTLSLTLGHPSLSQFDASFSAIRGGEGKGMEGTGGEGREWREEEGQEGERRGG